MFDYNRNYSYYPCSMAILFKIALSSIIIIIQIEHLIPARRPDMVIINKKKEKKKRTCYIVDFAVLVDNRVKVKETEKKRDTYLDLARELRKLWNVRVTVILYQCFLFALVQKTSPLSCITLQNHKISNIWLEV